MACTTSFGPAGKPIDRSGTGVKPPAANGTQGDGDKEDSVASSVGSIKDDGTDGSASSEGRQVQQEVDGSKAVVEQKMASPKIAEKPKSSVISKPEAVAAMAAAKEATEKGDMTGMCPPSKLGQFYEFFSFANLTPPIQCECSSLLPSLVWTSCKRIHVDHGWFQEDSLYAARE